MTFKEAIKTQSFFLITAILSLSTMGATGVITFFKVNIEFSNIFY